MPFNDLYRRQVSLLIRIIPFVAREIDFALKGGTAINLFVRDMPRLSVDIDLTYLPVKSRKESLAGIEQALMRIATAIRNDIPGAHVAEGRTVPEGAITKINVRANDVQIKIEVTPVLRGCVYDPLQRAVSESVETNFGYAETQVVSFADLYAGKLVAALDRQHPRDLFDVRDLLANEGIDEQLRRSFVIYLISHNRPMYELLAPVRKNITSEFERGFLGMTEMPVTLDDLLDARENLIQNIVIDMPNEHRRFLIDFERGNPDWTMLGIETAADLPAVKWRQRNLDTLKKSTRDELAEKLEDIFGA